MAGSVCSISATPRPCGAVSLRVHAPHAQYDLMILNVQHDQLPEYLRDVDEYRNGLRSMLFTFRRQADAKVVGVSNPASLDGPQMLIPPPTISTMHQYF